MNLIADIGNTRAKVFAMERGEVLECVSGAGDWAAAIARMAERWGVEACACSEVGRTEPRLLEALQATGRPVLRVTGTTPTPLRNAYATPATLGADRLAAAVGAAELQPASNLLVIDVGTCLTMDLVTADGCFMGGNISPGLGMRLRALHEFTAKLPRLDAAACLETARAMGDDAGGGPAFGRTTREAIAAGVVQAMHYEIEGYVRAMEMKFPSLFVFLTGGDSAEFVKPLKSPIFANCNLVARGLERILEYNQDLRTAREDGCKVPER